MSTITKERVAGIASGEKCYTHDDVVELARIALASLEAEAVVSHIGSKNALDAIVAFIKSNRNPTLKDHKEVSERLFQDNCHGLSNHVIEYIKQIGEELEELRSAQDSAPPASAPADVTAEPVAFVMVDDLKDSSIISTPAYRDLGEAMERTVGDVVALYAAPPASVSLDAIDKLSNFIASQELLGKDFEKVLAENIEGLYVPGNSAPPAPVYVPDCFKNAVSALESLYRNGQKQNWNERYTTDMAYASGVLRACRTAMLQGGKS